jgi:hypothetical protein
MSSTTFKASFQTVIETEIRKLKRDQVESMSAQNLWQMVSSKVPKGAPVGTNAAWVVKSIFEDIVRESPVARSFTSDAAVADDLPVAQAGAARKSR